MAKLKTKKQQRKHASRMRRQNCKRQRSSVKRLRAVTNARYKVLAGDEELLSEKERWAYEDWKVRTANKIEHEQATPRQQELYEECLALEQGWAELKEAAGIHGPVIQ